MSDAWLINEHLLHTVGGLRSTCSRRAAAVDLWFKRHAARTPQPSSGTISGLFPRVPANSGRLRLLPLINRGGASRWTHRENQKMLHGMRHRARVRISRAAGRGDPTSRLQCEFEVGLSLNFKRTAVT